MTAKPKRDVRLPKTSLLERLDRPKGVSFSDFTEYRKSSAEALDARFKILEAQQDIQTKDIAWLKTGQESQTSELKDFGDRLERFAKPSLWPLWTMLIVELAGLAYLLAEHFQVIGGSP
jgi:hypothetical protein